MNDVYLNILVCELIKTKRMVDIGILACLVPQGSFLLVIISTFYLAGFLSNKIAMKMKKISMFS